MSGNAGRTETETSDPDRREAMLDRIERFTKLPLFEEVRAMREELTRLREQSRQEPPEG